MVVTHISGEGHLFIMNTILILYAYFKQTIIEAMYFVCNLTIAHLIMIYS